MVCSWESPGLEAPKIARKREYVSSSPHTNVGLAPQDVKKKRALQWLLARPLLTKARGPAAALGAAILLLLAAIPPS